MAKSRRADRNAQRLMPKNAESAKHFAPMVCGLLVLAVAILYGRTGSYQFVNFDDPVLVSENPVVTGPLVEAVAKSFKVTPGKSYQPIRQLAYAVQYQLWQLDAGGYHLVNALFHALASIFLFLFLRLAVPQLWPDRGTRECDLLAACTAAWFAIHPVNVEAVAWVSSLKYGLLASGGFAALYCYTRATANAERVNWGWHCAGAAALGFAMLSSPFAVILPGLVMLFDLCRSSEAPIAVLRKRALGYLPALLVWTLVSIRIRAGLLEGTETIVIERARETSASAGGILRAFAFYLGHEILPLGLNNKYPNRIIPLTSPAALGGGAGLLLLVGWAAWQWRRGIRSSAFCVGWFLIALILVSSIFHALSTIMADRYLYLAGPGLLLAVMAGLLRIPQQKLRTGVIAAIFVLHGGLAFQRVGIWQNSETLWQDSLAKARDNALALNCLAMYWEQGGKIAEAGPLYYEATTVDPEYTSALERWGTWALNAGRAADARPALEKCIELGHEPAAVWHNLGVAYHGLGNMKKAQQYLEKAYGMVDAPVDCALNLGVVYKLQENWESAEKYLRIAMDQGRPKSSFEYGMHWYLRGNAEEAVKAWQETLRRDPKYADAHHNIGVVYGASRKFAKAIHHLEETLRLVPAHPTAPGHLETARKMLAAQK